VFIDSNTFIYPVDEFEPRKGKASEGWLLALSLSDAGVANLQVLNEVINVIIRKANRFAGIDPFPLVDQFAQFGSSPLTAEASTAARMIHERYRYSWWDCLLLASALELGCTHFLSEDLQDGQRIERAGRSLTIVDPFAHSPEQILG
jgi:predicted nucleic acid-binding protein